MSGRFGVTLAFFVFVVLPAAVPAAPWPEVESDMPPDPAVRRGVLPNGMRFAILPNGEPKDRVSLRLLVSAGSLHEREEERGLAHFVEHMAFRGTREHPAGSVIAALQRLGMGMGPDNTAFTNYDHTIYHLELPDTQEATLREGLGVFREYAEGITFDPELIERERGVILSEKATRNTPDYRAGQAGLAFLWPNARHGRRAAIGTEAAVRAFTREQFVAFYDAWYRPERMAVIIVGNVTPDFVEKIVTEIFSGLAARGAPREEPPDLVVPAASNPNIRVFVDPGLIGMSLALEHPRSVPRAPDTHARRVEAVQQGLAFTMFQQRLEAAARQFGSAFGSPSATLSASLPGWQVATVAVASKIDSWQSAARDVEQEHRRAFTYGFTAAELAQAKASFDTSLEQAERSAPTRPSPWLAAQLAGSLLNGGVFTTPAAWRRDLAPTVAAATLDECRDAFRNAWSAGSPHVFVAAHPSFAVTPRELAAVLNTSRATKVEAPVEAAPVAFAYSDFGPAGKLVREEKVPDLDVRLGEFANGVRLNFKPTAFEADLVEIHVRVGSGRLTLPENRPGLALLAEGAFTGGGLLKHSSQELKTLLAGRALTINFRVGTDAFEFAARCAPRDFALSLQVIAAYLTSAAYRVESLAEARAWYNSMLASLAAAPGGPITMRAQRTLLGGDRRFGVPDATEFYAEDLKSLARWLDDGFERAPVELSVVGDIGWEDAADGVARTLGALPQRQPRTGAPRAGAVRFAPAPPEVQVFATDAKTKQAAIAWYWPVTDLGDVRHERRCRMLAAIISDRLRTRLREELGAAYSPAAEFVEMDGFRAFSYFVVYAEVEPARAQSAAQIIRKEAAALQAGGLSEDEFIRARQPFVREYNDSLRSNGYWGYTVLRDAQQRPERLAAARDRTADTAAITRAEIDALARRYLDPAQGFLFVAEPAPTHFWGAK